MTFSIHWNSSENHIALNPKFPKDQVPILMDLIEEGRKDLRGHIFLLTSGTTAVSVSDLKWVALKKEAFLASADSVNRHLQSDSQDVWIHHLPDFHVGGLGIWARAALSGAQVVTREAWPKTSQEARQEAVQETWNAEAFVQTIRNHRGTLASLVPAQVYDLVHKRLDCPPSMRAIVVGGGALHEALYAQAQELGWPLLPSYGMTETCSQVATAPLDSSLNSFVSQTSVSKKLPPIQILSHAEIQLDQDQRLRVKGPSLLTAYFYQLNGQKIWEDPKRDGWFHSQDRGEILGDYLKILGRVGDFIKIGGESVELGRLQQILSEVCIQIKLSANVALLPFPDDRLGYVIHLVVEQSLSQESVSELVSLYNVKVLGFEKIRKTHSLDRIPRTDLGKIKTAECYSKLQ
jgi:O-succinylbenzoic acid--CoA ligase